MRFAKHKWMMCPSAILAAGMLVCVADVSGHADELPFPQDLATAKEL